MAGAKPAYPINTTNNIVPTISIYLIRFSLNFKFENLRENIGISEIIMYENKITIIAQK